MTEEEKKEGETTLLYKGEKAALNPDYILYKVLASKGMDIQIEEEPIPLPKYPDYVQVIVKGDLQTQNLKKQVHQTPEYKVLFATFIAVANYPTEDTSWQNMLTSTHLLSDELKLKIRATHAQRMALNWKKTIEGAQVRIERAKIAAVSAKEKNEIESSWNIENRDAESAKEMAEQLAKDLVIEQNQLTAQDLEEILGKLINEAILS